MLNYVYNNFFTPITDTEGLNHLCIFDLTMYNIETEKLVLQDITEDSEWTLKACHGYTQISHNITCNCSKKQSHCLYWMIWKSNKEQENTICFTQPPQKAPSPGDMIHTPKATTSGPCPSTPKCHPSLAALNLLKPCRTWTTFTVFMWLKGLSAGELQQKSSFF